MSDLSLVRGVDYKSRDGRGLELLVTHCLPSRRELKQLLGRVGRYGEDCARYHLAEMPTDSLVDIQNEATVAGNISRN